MDVQGVDPRDTEWEVLQPAYRVYFFTGDVETGYRSDEYEISNADVPEVLAWAGADGRDYVAYVLHRDGDSPGLIRLAGTDPVP